MVQIKFSIIFVLVAAAIAPVIAHPLPVPNGPEKPPSKKAVTPKVAAKPTVPPKNFLVDKPAKRRKVEPAPQRGRSGSSSDSDSEYHADIDEPIPPKPKQQPMSSQLDPKGMNKRRFDLRPYDSDSDSSSGSSTRLGSDSESDTESGPPTGSKRKRN